MESTSSPPGQQSGFDRVFAKLDEQMALHMRTREDLIEVKGDVRGLKDGALRHEQRQSEFESGIARRLREHAEHTDSKIGEIDVKVTGLDSQVTEIREERIAEKAQWRGPEKVIAAIGGLAVVLGLLLAVKELFHL